MALYEIERARLSALKGEGDYMHPVFGEGTPGARLVLIGEAPGAQEAAAGRPFVGKAGKQLDALLDCVGLKRGDIFITNAVKFRPTKHEGRSNRTPTGGEMREGLALLRDELELIAPRIVATLGNVPLQSVSKLAGLEKITIGQAHGRKIECGKFVLFPLYHPASVIYNRTLEALLEADITALANVLLDCE
jgi:DNA polymerase